MSCNYPTIYVSTGGVQGDTIAERVETLVRAGFSKIELSGGTMYYEKYLEDLLKLQKSFGLEYLIHNYFPPPREDFVLNLASENEYIREMSLEFCGDAIEKAAILGSPTYSVHAGFYFDPDLDELGAKIKERKLYDIEFSQRRFEKNIERLNELSSKHGMKLYIENNVLDLESYQSLNNVIPAMLPCAEDAHFLKSRMVYNFLLDTGHLKVSTQTLGLNFLSECSNLLSISDYLHISDNNGSEDEHELVTEESSIYEIIKNFDLSNKIAVLEIWGSTEKIKSSYDLLFNLVQKNNRRWDT